MSFIGPVEPPAPVAFESLYQDCRTRLTQQVFLLTGHRRRAEHCVRRAFQRAWTDWDAVAADPSPEGWVRAVAFELALSPWHPARLRRPVHGPGLSGRDRQLLTALLRLPRPQRRALVLHDALGLDWRQTAAEVESSTPAAFGRVVRARLAVARLAPRLAGPDAREPGYGRRLGPLLRGAAVRGCPARAAELPPPGRVRRRARLRERAVNGAVGLVTAAVAGGLVAGLAVGTPWHPPTEAFITYGHPAPTAAVLRTRPVQAPVARVAVASAATASVDAAPATGTADDPFDGVLRARPAARAVPAATPEGICGLFRLFCHRH